MIRAMRTAASGMMAQQTQVDTIANNIANVNTAGFKKNRVNFRSLLYTTLREPGSSTSATQMNPTGLQIGGGSEVASSVKLFNQGDIQSTGNVLDIAINGAGFFKIATGAGDFLYSRDGSFRIDGNGDMVTTDGFRLDPGVTIPENAQEIVIGQDGTVQIKVDGQAALQNVGNITLTRFANDSGLKAVGGNMFRETASSGAPTELQPGDVGAGLLRQGFLERSNVAVVDELIALIEAQRNYEVNSRTIRVSDEMLQQVSQLI